MLARPSIRATAGPSNADEAVRSVDDGKAIDAVRQCKFEPATLDGGAGRPLLHLAVNLLRE